MGKWRHVPTGILHSPVCLVLNKCFSISKRSIWKTSNKNYCDSKYKLAKLDIQGQRINIDIEFVKNGRNLVFTSGWMVRPKGENTNNTPLAD